MQSKNGIFNMFAEKAKGTHESHNGALPDTAHLWGPG